MKDIDSGNNSHQPQNKNLSSGSVIHVIPSKDWDTPQIISPPITAAFAILAGGVVSLLIWSFTYKLPITASSEGLLYQGPRLHGVSAKSAGIISNVQVVIGQKVQRGQQLATIDIKYDQVKMSAATKQRSLASNNRLIASRLIPAELNQQIQASQKLLKELNKNLSSQTKVLKKKKDNLMEYKSLASKGYLSEVEVLKYEEQLIAMYADIGKLRAQQNQLIAERDKTKRQLATTLNSARTDLSQAQENESLSVNRLEAARVLSPVDGYIVQITKRKGQLTSEGMELFVISPIDSKGLQSAFLISGKDAGRIKEGDKALISPSSAPAQRFGYIQGKVTMISPYPTNPASFARFVGSENLAIEVFTSQESKLPFLVRIEPEYNDGKLVWNGSKGPAWDINSGILATAKIIYQERLPVSYLLPWIKSTTGLDNF